MYPYKIFLGTDLYTIFLCAGIIAAILIFRIMADKLSVPAKLQNITLISGIGAVILGCFSAVLFQALYNIGKNGGFVIEKNTGATFYGGLIGGAAVFFSIYFILGKIFLKNREHISHFFRVVDIGICSLTAAHALGRIGCLMAGCCHGRETDAWFGMEMLIGGTMKKVIPTQLFEAIFLFLLFAFFVWRNLRGKGHCLELYMCAYGVWRFFIEYLRGDYRGTTVISFFTPSQLVAVLMVTGGLAIFFARKKLAKPRKSETEK